MSLNPDFYYIPKSLDTKEERLVFYKRLLQHMSLPVCDVRDKKSQKFHLEYMGFCGMATDLTMGEFYFYENADGNLLRDLLPELWDKKPTQTHDSEYWFSLGPQGREIRLEILQEIIAEMESETK